VSAALAVCGWSLAVGLALALVEARRRIELGARAEHELRGPLAAIALGVESLARETAGRPPVLDVLHVQLDRVQTGLADLEAARRGRRSGASAAPVALEPLVRAAGLGLRASAASGGGVEVDWRAGAATVKADRGRVSQALGNLLDNAAEHGGGQVRLRAVRAARAVRIEVSDSGPGFPTFGRSYARRRRRSDARGRGLRIAARAIEDSGGSLSIQSSEAGATVAVELPLAER